VPETRLFSNLVVSYRKTELQMILDRGQVMLY